MGARRGCQHLAGWITALLTGSSLRVALGLDWLIQQLRWGSLPALCGSSGVALSPHRVPRRERGQKAEPAPGFISHSETRGNTCRKALEESCWVNGRWVATLRGWGLVLGLNSFH